MQSLLPNLLVYLTIYLKNTNQKKERLCPEALGTSGTKKEKKIFLHNFEVMAMRLTLFT